MLGLYKGRAMEYTLNLHAIDSAEKTIKKKKQGVPVLRVIKGEKPDFHFNQEDETILDQMAKINVFSQMSEAQKQKAIFEQDVERAFSNITKEIIRIRRRYFWPRS